MDSTGPLCSVKLDAIGMPLQQALQGHMARTKDDWGWDRRGGIIPVSSTFWSAPHLEADKLRGHYAVLPAPVCRALGFNEQAPGGGRHAVQGLSGDTAGCMGMGMPGAAGGCSSSLFRFLTTCTWNSLLVDSFDSRLAGFSTRNNPRPARFNSGSIPHSTRSNAV
jgi:hypothetical protein